MDPGPSRLIDDHIAALDDWRGQLMAELRRLILEADPAVSEQWKWNTPVWAHDGLVCAAAAFKGHVKLNFFKGASLDDPDGLFNGGLDAKATRSIDFHQGDRVDAPGVIGLVRAAIALNASRGK
jgi:hypothetical protein